MLFVSGYKYLLTCVDASTKYTWVFPLKLKSEVHSTFTHFIAPIRVWHLLRQILSLSLAPSNQPTFSLTVLCPQITNQEDDSRLWHGRHTSFESLLSRP